MKIVTDGQKRLTATADSDGSDVRLSSYKGKVVLLNFWATWCHGCKLEIPWLIDFQNQYKDRGFTVIGVSLDDAGSESGQAVPCREAGELPGRGRDRRSVEAIQHPNPCLPRS